MLDHLQHHSGKQSTDSGTTWPILHICYLEGSACLSRATGLRLHPQTFKGVNLFVMSTWDLFLDLRMTLILCYFSHCHLRLQAVIDANIFPVLIEILQKAEFRTRKEAAWAITNATSGGTPEQIRCALSVPIARLKHLKNLDIWQTCRQEMTFAICRHCVNQINDITLIFGDRHG